MSIDRNNKLAIVAYYMAYGYELTNFRESANRSGKSNDFDKSQCASKSFKKCNTFLVVSFLRLLCYLVLLYVPLMAVYIYIFVQRPLPVGRDSNNDAIRIRIVRSKALQYNSVFSYK